MPRENLSLEWVLLSYRLPRVPSSPRVAVWRRLQALGVAQLSDGLVALPADARTREHLEWVAADIEARGGDATLWLSRPTSPERERGIVDAMTEGRRREYRVLAEEARTAVALDEPARARIGKKLRARLREVARRDYFPPLERDAAAAAVLALLQPTRDQAGLDLSGKPRTERVVAEAEA